MDISADRKQQIKEFYLQDAVIDEMVRIAEYREVAPTYPSGYGRRPDAVNFPGDFRQFVEDGAVAFHGSVERWRNPLLIDDVDSDDLRTGWDLVIDIDCDADLSFAKIAAQALIDEFCDFGIDHVSAKFSGNRGFHLGIRGEAFPNKLQGTPIARWYPDLPQTIVSFLRHRLKEQLAEAFVDHDATVRDTVYTDGDPTPYRLCDIENDWGDRHLFRMPYSVNEKSWLVAVPLALDAIADFKKPDAAIDTVTVEESFLDSYEDGEATELAVEALDWYAEHHEDDARDRESFDGEFSIPDDALDEEHFPPTIHNILGGLKDGRKRSVFILATFLRQVGYDWDAVAAMVRQWNDRNDDPLPDNYITSQLNWHRAQDEPLMPPNWDDGSVYHDIGVYEEDPLTRSTSNPVSYAFARASDDDDAHDDSGGSTPEYKAECPYCGKRYKREGHWYKEHVKECFG